MNLNVSLKSIELYEEVPNYWKTEDYKAILACFDFPDADSIAPENLREYVLMAITDDEPAEAAEKILNTFWSEYFTEGQMKQLSHDMLVDKVSEEYPDIPLQYPLYSANQLLRKAYNGKFPNAKCCCIEFELGPIKEEELSKEIALKAIAAGLKENSIIKRLYENALEGLAEFESAESIVWELKVQPEAENLKVEIWTSEYWINPEVIGDSNYSVEIKMFNTEVE